MTPQARDLFVQARDMEPAAREAFLAEACGDDAGLRLEVQRMLVNAERADSYFGDTEGSTLGAAEFAETYAEKEGDVIGPFKLRQSIGEGGFGTVWMAEQSNPISRMVALKVIKAGMDTRHVLARFEAERQALAMMDHPNIAKVLDAGATPTGRPWFAMELVKGIPITQYCDEAGLGTRERLVLFRDVCSAINHAHQKGIIHRDIKPSNVMVTLYADKPVVKVIDFGIAKATQGKLTDQTLFTRFEQFIGTPVYMSPEQAAISAVDIDTRSDIYALGILLYELLVGKPPFDGKTLVSAGYDEMRRIIREVEPVKPSSRLGTIMGEERTHLAKTRRIEEAKIGRLVEPDLDWIVMKAIEKDRTRRYETANAFAEDLRRFLSDEPVTATPPSKGYQFRKFARRHKEAICIAALIAVLLVAATLVSSWQAVRATKAEKQAVSAQKDAEAVSEFLTGMFGSPVPGREKGGREVKVADVLDIAVKDMEVKLADQPERLAQLRITLGLTYRALGLHREAIQIMEQARDFQQSHYGPEDPRTVASMGDLATSYAYVGRLAEALRLREEVLTLFRKVLGPEHDQTVVAMANLAHSWNAAGRRDEAIQLQTQVLELRRKLSGPKGRDTVTAMGNLAGYYADAGRNDQALMLGEEGLALRREVLGPEAPETLGAMNNLAVYYAAAGRNDQALKLLEESVPLCRKVLGEKHPDTLNTIHNLAIHYFAASRRDEALKLREEVLALRRTDDPEHPDTIMAIHHLAFSYFDVGRRDEAFELSEEGLAISRRVLPDHPNTLRIMSELARLYAIAGRWDNAIKLGEEVLALRRKVDPEHRDTLTAIQALATFCFEAGRKDEALTLQEDALPLFRKVYGSEDPATIKLMNNLAATYQAVGQQDKALTTTEEVLALHRKTHGDKHADTLRVMYFLAGYCAEASRWDEAIKLANELLTLRREIDGPEATDTIFAMGSLAQYLLSAERYADACKLHEEVLPLFRKQFGETHPYTLDAMTKLAICYSSLERTDAALKLQEDALKMMKSGAMLPSQPIFAIALDHMAKLYDKTGRKDEAAKLQAELAELENKTKSAE